MTPITKRPSREDTFMEVARLYAKRSTCRRGQVGAVLVKDKRIVGVGYNGAPPGEIHCQKAGCDVVELYTVTPHPRKPNEMRLVPYEMGCQRAIHAEANAIAWAARMGVPLNGASLYCTAGPCLKCAQLILSAGIAHVFYEDPYRDSAGETLLEESIHCSIAQQLGEVPF